MTKSRDYLAWPIRIVFYQLCISSSNLPSHYIESGLANSYPFFAHTPTTASREHRKYLPPSYYARRAKRRAIHDSSQNLDKFIEMPSLELNFLLCGYLFSGRYVSISVAITYDEAVARKVFWPSLNSLQAWSNSNFAPRLRNFPEMMSF